MCGIIGYFNRTNSFNPQRFSFANNIAIHRGPDDFGYITIDQNFDIESWEDEYLKDFSGKNIIGAFGFRRLSIIDLSKSGHQPMSDSTKNFWIIFNGEIFNYIEIRIELEKCGYKFRSNTDTEVILNAYKAWGKDCLNKFNGMWSFCLFDRKERKLFCARDRFGIKPFYYSFENDTFAFGSEIKQLLELFPGQFYELNKRILFDFLALGSYGNETSETYFEKINKLSPGCYLEIDLNELNGWKTDEVRWWDLPSENYSTTYSEENIYDTVRHLFEDSVLLRLRSDVPLGTALSGGLDSSGIVTMVNKIFNSDVDKNKVFTITTYDSEIDDTYFAKIVTDNIPVKNYTRDFEEHANIFDLEKFIWHQEEPVQTSSIFGSWLLYKFIKNMGITVVLEGQGADELMGGYNRVPYRKYSLDIIKKFGFRYYINQVKRISSVYNVSEMKIFYNTAFSLINELFKIFPTYYYSKKLSYVKNFLDNDFYREGFNNSQLIRKDYLKEEINLSSILKRQSYELTKHTNLPGILRQVDRNSMAFSLEARLPFLDYRLVEFLFTLPINFMIRNGYSKYAYRMAMKDILPTEVLWRKTKIGFKMPEYSMLRENKHFVKETINTLLDSKYLSRNYLNKKIDFHLDQGANYNNIIWRILCFAIWKNKFNLK